MTVILLSFVSSQLSGADIRPRQTLSGHSGFVEAVAFSPDGKWIASAGKDGTVVLWDAATCKEKFRLEGQTDRVTTVAFSPDSKLLASGGFDKTIWVWDVATGKKASVLREHTRSVYTVAFSPDGKLLVSGGSDRTILFWDTETFKKTAELDGGFFSVSAVSFSGDGRLLAAGSHGGTVTIWDVDSRKAKVTIDTKLSVIAAVLSPDGKTLAIASGSLLTVDKPGKIALWDVETKKERADLSAGHTSTCWRLAFSKDGKKLITASLDKTAKIWDAATGREIHTLSGHTDAVMAAGFSPNGKSAVTGGFDKTVRVWDLDAATGPQLIRSTLRRHTAEVATLALSPDGRWLVSGSLDKTACVWEVATGKEKATLTGHTDGVLAVAFSPDNKTVATASMDKTIILWDATTGKKIAALPAQKNEVTALAFSPDGKTLASGTGYIRGAAGELVLWDVEKSRQLAVFTGNKRSIFALHWASDGSLFSGGGEPKQAHELIEWDLEKKKPKTTYDALATGIITSVALAPNGKSLVVAHYNRAFVSLDRKTGKILTEFKGHATEVQGVAISSDGKRIVSASDDRSVRIWDETGKSLAVLNGHVKSATVAAFIPNSTLLASADASGAVIVWDLAVALGTNNTLPGEDLSFSRFVSRKGGFRIVLPGEPEEKSRKIPTPIGELTVTVFIVREKRATYAVGYSQLPELALRLKTPAQHLDDAVGGAVGTAGKKLEDNPITLGDHPGRELITVSTDGQIYSLTHFYFLRGAIYQISVSGPGRESITSEGSVRFLESFRELPPELTAAERKAKEKELEQLLTAAEAARTKKDYPGVVRELEKARAVTRTLGKDFERFLGAMTGDLAQLYWMHLGRPDLAEPLYRDAIADLEGGTDPLEVALSAGLMCRLAQLYQQQQEYGKAEPLLRRALGKAANNQDVVCMAKIILGQVYHSQNLDQKAEPMFREGIAAGKGLDDPAGMLDVAKYHLAMIRKKAGHADEAEQQLREIIPSAEAGSGKEPTAAYLAVSGLLDLYTESGKNDAALTLAARVPTLAKRNTAASTKALASVYIRVYSLHLNRGDLLQADAVARDCVRHLETAFGPKHPLLADLAHQVGVIKLLRGDLTASEASLRRSLEILHDPARPNRREQVPTLEALAGLYCFRGDYVKAEKTCQAALAVLDALKVSPRDLGRAHVRATQALILSSSGRQGEAMALLEEIVKNLSNDLDSDNLALAAVLSLVSELYGGAGELSKAEVILNHVTAILERKFGPEHPFVAMQLLQLAQFNLQMNRLDEGLRLARKGAAVLEATQGKDSLLAGLNLMTIARLHVARGERKQAKESLERCRRIVATQMGQNHPTQARVLMELAELSVWEGEYDLATRQLDEARQIDFRHAHHILPALAESEQMAFLRDIDTPALHTALSLALARPKDQKLVARSAAWVLNGKGSALNILAERQLLARQSTDPAVGKLVRSWLQVRQELAGVTMSAPEPGKEAERGQRLAQLRRVESDLSRELGLAIGRTERTWVELDAVRRALPADGVLVELVRMDLFRYPTPDVKHDPKASPWQPARYVAWIIPPGDQEPVRVVDLGPAKDIDLAIRSFREKMADAANRIKVEGLRVAEQQIRESLSGLHRLVLQPLLPHIEAKERWFISPDGETWLIPFAALPLGEGKYAIETHRIRYLVSGRDLLWSAPKVRLNPPLVMADPDYYLDFDEARKETRLLLKQPLPEPAPRRLSVRTFDGISRQWGLLEGTATEAKTITPYLKTYAGAEPVVLTKRQALEGVFRATERPSVVVLSTHGFIVEPPGFAGQSGPETGPGRYTDDPLDRVFTTIPGQSGTFSMRDILRLSEHPALCCGLVLAGANKRGQGDPLGEDGILTAWEILGVDLRGTRLVVLSACETALGRVQDNPFHGACVAGLRQAFLVAGSRRVVATLWEIPDQETAPLMEEFFKRLAAGDTEDDALRAAQLARIAAHREKTKKKNEKQGVAHPLFWAAFTLTSQGP